MFAAIFNRITDGASALGPWLQWGAAALGVGVAIRLMDDQLDGVDDGIAGETTSAHVLGPGAVPYALVSLLAATLVRPDAAAALFFGAYAAGMVHDGNLRLPTGVPAWFESAVAAGASVVVAGLSLAAAAGSLMVFVQCIDDIVDEDRDDASGADNWVRRLGKVEVRFLASAALLFAVSLSPGLVVAVFVALAVIDGVFRRLVALGDGASDGRRRGGAG